MRFSLMIFCLLFSLLSWGEFDPRTDIISEKYEAGAYLIYDCQDKHWVCVLEEYYRDCESQRSQDLSMNKLDLRCAPMGQLPTKQSCFQRQLYVSGQNYGQRFCVGDSWKEKEIRF
jgi:hypothetical protein